MARTKKRVIKRSKSRTPRKLSRKSNKRTRSRSRVHRKQKGCGSPESVRMKRREREDESFDDRDNAKKAVSERKIFKARRQVALPPVFLPNDPYAFNPRKRREQFDEKEREQKRMVNDDNNTSDDDDEFGLEKRKVSPGEAIFDDDMPTLIIERHQNDDELDEAMKNMYL